MSNTNHPERAAAAEVWGLITDLALDHDRRREVTDALNISFSRARALRRVARQAMTMGQLAAALDIDRPNATTLVDDLERQDLVRRTPHPTDRRATLVEATPKGKRLARRADRILATPPDSLTALSDDDLFALRRILRKVATPSAHDDLGT